jgi:ATP-dependent RNA circularization protein (DNA/RNA ligase family)
MFVEETTGYKKTDRHSFWVISERHQIESKLRNWFQNKGQRIALQGECVGPGIQKNPMGLEKIDFYVFNVVDIQSRRRLCYDEMVLILNEMNLKMVPVLEKGDCFYYKTKERTA